VNLGDRSAAQSTAPEPARDAEIHALVKRLSRPHSSGGDVVERAALLAAGSDFTAAMAWITEHAGVPETMLPQAPRRGLHGARLGISDSEEQRIPLRFVLPAGALD
jgi:hypothetical protein